MTPSPGGHPTRRPVARPTAIAASVGGEKRPTTRPPPVPYRQHAGGERGREPPGADGPDGALNDQGRDGVPARQRRAAAGHSRRAEQAGSGELGRSKAKPSGTQRARRRAGPNPLTPPAATTYPAHQLGILSAGLTITWQRSSSQARATPIAICRVESPACSRNRVRFHRSTGLSEICRPFWPMTL